MANLPKKSFRRAALFLASAAAFVALLIWGYYENSLRMPEYTVFNNNKDGTSLFQDALREYGIPVKTGFREIRPGEPLGDVHIVIAPDYRYEDWGAILDWVELGGRLIYANRNYYDEFREDGFGEMFFTDANLLTNGALMDDRRAGEAAAEALKHWKYENVYINEYYHGYSENGGMWRDLPAAYKLAAVQAGLFAVFAALFLGKRLARPVPLYEETERGEGEHLAALANLFARARAGDAPVLSLYDELIRRSAGYFGLAAGRAEEEIENLWLEEGLPYANTLRETVSLCRKLRESGQKLKDIKRMKKAAADIETLTGVIDDRGKRLG